MAPCLPDPALLLPPAIAGFVTITEVDHAEFLAGAVFRRKFDDAPPDEPHHLVAFYRTPGGAFEQIGYSHMRPFGDIYLSGGSNTNGDAIRRMLPEHAAALRAAGGIWFWILKYAFARYHDACDAFFGYSGDRRAREVTAAAGFVDAGHPHLIVHWHKPLHESIRRALVAKAHALGPF